MKKWIESCKKLNEVAECEPEMYKETIKELITEIEQLEKMLIEALNEWQYSSKYKEDYLQSKHKDLERIAEIREILKGKVK